MRHAYARTVGRHDLFFNRGPRPSTPSPSQARNSRSPRPTFRISSRTSSTSICRTWRYPEATSWTKIPCLQFALPAHRVTQARRSGPSFRPCATCRPLQPSNTPGNSPNWRGSQTMIWSLMTCYVHEGCARPLPARKPKPSSRAQIRFCPGSSPSKASSSG